MSTRANIIITDGEDKLYFYRHSDGYPEGTMPTLEKFLAMVKNGQIRDNTCQSAGWLIMIGYDEYKEYQPDWKVGAYEPTTGIHGDIEYLYVVDLVKKNIRQIKPKNWPSWE
jgi:hypothetical protein